jgi:hypothetical protein
MNKEQMLEEVTKVFQSTQTQLEGMSDGERTSLKDLAAKVAIEVSKAPREVLNFVDFFVHKTDLAHVARGKNGGIVKGAKTVKVKSTSAKPRKKASKKDAE